MKLEARQPSSLHKEIARLPVPRPAAFLGAPPPRCGTDRYNPDFLLPFHALVNLSRRSLAAMRGY